MYLDSVQVLSLSSPTGLSNKISWQDLKDFGRGISNGKKEGHLRIVHSDVYHNNGTGILEYETRQDAIRAVTELNQTVIVNPYDSVSTKKVQF